MFWTTVAWLAVCFGADAMAAGADRNDAGDVALPPPAEFHLFLLVGQSNMAGRGEVEAQDRAPIPGVLALNAQGEWLVAVDPIHFDKPSAGVGLARSFAMRYLADHPGVMVGLIPSACGGSPIAAWQREAYFDQTNSHPYDDAVRRARRAMQDGTLKGILWHQGESDCKPELAPKYRESLGELIGRFRTELDANEVPFILGQLGEFAGAPWNEATRQVDAATRAVALELRLVGFVSSRGLLSKPDNLHFDSASLREFGLRYYEAFRSVGKATERNR